MSRRSQILYLVSFAVFLRSFAQVMFTPLALPMRNELGATTAVIGLTLGIYGFFLAVSQIVYGPIIDRFDSKRVLLAGIALYIVGSLGGYVTQGIELLLAARALQAFGIAAAIVGIALIADLFPATERGRAIGIYSMFSTTGAVAGPIAGSVLAIWLTWRQDFLALALVGIALLLFTIWKLPGQPVRGQRVGLGDMLNISRTRATFGALILGLMQFWGIYTSHTLTPIMASERLGLNESAAGWLVACVPIGVITGSWLGGHLTDLRGLRFPIIVGAIGALFGFGSVTLLSAITTPATPALIVAAALMTFGLFAGLGGPAQLNLMVNKFPAMRATAGGLQLFARNIGATLAPVLAGFLADRWGLAAGFGLGTALLAVATVIGAFAAGETSVVDPSVM